MATRMQQRRGTAEQWTTANPTLAEGEVGFETDTYKFKIGNGVNVWSSLDYFSAGTDLTGYATESYVDTAVSNIVDSAPGVLDTLNELAAAIGDDADFVTTVNSNITNGDSATLASAQSYADAQDAATLAAANTYADTEIANLVDSSPAALDTLNELAAALGDDPNFATTVTNQIAGKADASHTHSISEVTGLQAELDGKAETLNDLSDVALTTPAVGEVLSYNGSNWVNSEPAGGGVLNFDSFLVFGPGSYETLTLPPIGPETDLIRLHEVSIFILADTFFGLGTYAAKLFVSQTYQYGTGLSVEAELSTNTQVVDPANISFSIDVIPSQPVISIDINQGFGGGTGFIYYGISNTVDVAKN